MNVTIGILLGCSVEAVPNVLTIIKKPELVTWYVLLLSSLLLARDSKGLLIGGAAHQRVRDAILRIAREDPNVRTANGVLTGRYCARRLGGYCRPPPSAIS